MSRTATLQPKAVEMVREGRAEALITGGILDGPLALDNAIDLDQEDSNYPHQPGRLTDRAPRLLRRGVAGRGGTAPGGV